MGQDAALTASELLSAYEACVVVGLPKLPDCQNDGVPLPQDLVAKSLASTALAKHVDYMASCSGPFGAEYFESLLQTALAVSSQK